MPFLIKQGDTRPNLEFVLWQAGKTARLDVTGATVSIVARAKGGTVMAFKRACVITDAANGVGYYAWQVADTAANGSYEYEFEIAWPGGALQTVPVDSYLEFVVVDDIG